MGIKSYNEGYGDAMRNVEQCIDNSIKRNGGAVSAQQVVKVLNDVITHVHEDRLELPKEDGSNEHYAVVYAVQDEQGGVWL